MATDNNEATAWNAGLGGGNSPTCVEKPMTPGDVAAGVTLVGLAAYGITAIGRDIGKLITKKK